MNKMEKPVSFKKAAILVYASLGVGLIKSLLYELLTDTKMISNPNNLVIGIFTIALIGFIAYHAGQAKNWARITFLVMFVLGGLMMPSIIIEEFRTVPIIGIITLIQTGLQLYVLIILFSVECKDWFKQLKQTN